MENQVGQEISIAKEIIAQGLAKAAESLSFFMKESITLKETDFDISNDKNVFIRTVSHAENLYVLRTEMKGELKGVCYLVFNKEEKDEICKAALPKDIVDNPEKLKSMEEPLLLEVDNIIAASVVTQISNHLKKKVYGDVPSLLAMSSDVLKSKIIEQMQPDKFIIGFQTEFISSKSHFHPEFFWILEPEFLNCVRELAIEKSK